MQSDLKERKILGRTHLHENRLAEALEVFSKILMDYPEDLETLQVLGNFYLASGDGQTAQKLYSRALELDPGNKVLIRQITLAEEVKDLRHAENIPSEFAQVADILQKLVGTQKTVAEADILRAATLLEKIIHSPNPAQLVAEYLDEIDELLPALLELNIRQAYADGQSELAESLRALQVNIDHQMEGREELSNEQQNPIQSIGVKRGILLLVPTLEKNKRRIDLIRQALQRAGYHVTESPEFNPQRGLMPDVVITSNPHVEALLINNLEHLSRSGVPIILDLDADFEKQPISHHEYNTHGLGSAAQSRAYTTALKMASLVTVPSKVQADSLHTLVRQVRCLPDGWGNSNVFWKKSPAPRNMIHLGWLGNSGELEDLVTVRRFIVRILREFSNTKVVVVGSPQAYRLFESLPDNRRLYLPETDPEEFPFLLGQIDVLMVPLRNTPFNISKADSVLMEAGARGIPWVASSIPAFRQWQHGGLLCESLEEWHLNLRHLVRNEELRQQLGSEGKQKAEGRELSQLSSLWMNAIEQALSPNLSINSTLPIYSMQER